MTLKIAKEEFSGSHKTGFKDIRFKVLKGIKRVYEKKAQYSFSKWTQWFIMNWL